jgi:integrase
MIRRREKPDGLPFRVYERRGVRDYSIGYKLPSGKWAFSLKCSVHDKAKILELRREAITRAGRIEMGAPAADSFAALVEAWFKWQEAKPLGSEGRRAESTLAENKREAKMLTKAFGHMDVQSMEKGDGYAYLDACERAGRPAKGNKEVGLAHTILEYGIRIGKLKSNPFDGIEKLVTKKYERLVTNIEMDLAVRVGRKLGGPRLICALALKTAWLCLRRSVEVRALSVAQITEPGIVWTAAKRKRGTAGVEGLIEWSPELRATIDEALAVPRNKDAGEWYVFGNLKGERYTKGGWKATLHDLMTACEAEAKAQGIAFQKFSLQDCRPKGVTDKLDKGHDDVIDATMHTNERMVRTTYDRRRKRVAKPVE